MLACSLVTLDEGRFRGERGNPNHPQPAAPSPGMAGGPNGKAATIEAWRINTVPCSDDGGKHSSRTPCTRSSAALRTGGALKPRKPVEADLRAAPGRGVVWCGRGVVWCGVNDESVKVAMWRKPGPR